MIDPLSDSILDYKIDLYAVMDDSDVMACAWRVASLTTVNLARFDVQ